MSQKEVILYLQKKKKPVDIKELLLVLPYNRATISRNCRVLRKNKEIKYKVDRGRRHLYFL